MIGKIILSGDKLVLESLSEKRDSNLLINPRQIKELNLQEGDLVSYVNGGLYQYIVIKCKTILVERKVDKKKDIPIIEQKQDNITQGKYNVYFLDGIFHKVYNWGVYECYKSLDGTNNFNDKNIESIDALYFKTNYKNEKI